MKYFCPACLGHIEMDGHYFGQAVTCPHCQAGVSLSPLGGPPPIIPQAPPAPAARPRETVKLSGYVCALCGSQGHPKMRARGSLLIEIILWCFFLVPGMIYSVWRLTTREKVCRQCGSASMIPARSPRGRQLLLGTS